MTTAQKDVHAMRTRTDGLVIATLEQHVADLQVAHDEAKKNLESAKTAFEDLDAELAVALAKRDSFREFLVKQQRSSLSRRLPTLPAEVLSNCFEQFCWDGNPFQANLGPEVQPDMRIANAPFTVAAVCKRWRTLALATSSLWCYMALPEPPEEETPAATAYTAYVLTIIERSKTFPLSIVIDWTALEDMEDRHDCTTILDAIGSQAHRWVRFQMNINISSAGPDMDWMNIFRSPTPKLRTMNCYARGQGELAVDWRNPYPRYLPVTPKLEGLRMSWFPLIPSGPLPLLQNAYLWMSNPPVSVVWDMLSKAPQLRNLLLEADKAETLTFVPTKVSLPKLETLYLRRSSIAFMSSYTAHLECPKVHYLDCAADQLARIDPFVQQRAHNIKTFVIHEGTVNVEAISTLKLLQKASTVEINGSAVQAGFWDALMAQDEVVLPALTKLRLVKVELDSDDDSLPRFVKSRRAIAPAQPTTPATSQQPVAQRLQRVEFVSADALPSWFVAEIQYIMAQDK